uniref:Uncharacterized protein n=1 Tax=Arundo donax TaxID=35708 RepID=A0A0A9FTT6_ARUDO
MGCPLKGKNNFLLVWSSTRLLKSNSARVQEKPFVEFVHAAQVIILQVLHLSFCWIP